MSVKDQEIVRNLFERHGRTFAEQAGIRLSDRPGPLYQLLVLSTVLSARISADVAVAAARELFRAGLRSPQAMQAAAWQDRVDALGRGHYRRYDERTATMLGDSAQLCIRWWNGDLRRLRSQAGGDPIKLRASLTEFPGIGPTGADIFVREVQAVWPEYEPFLDRKVRAGAARLDLPSTPEALAGLVDPTDLPRLASALVRVSLDRRRPDLRRRSESRR
jgi:endonuclease III